MEFFQILFVSIISVFFFQAHIRFTWHVKLGSLRPDRKKEFKTNRKKEYKQYSDKDRFVIGKYASENGPAAAVRKFKKDFVNINESTVRGFRKRRLHKPRKIKGEQQLFHLLKSEIDHW